MRPVALGSRQDPRPAIPSIAAAVVLGLFAASAIGTASPGRASAAPAGLDPVLETSLARAAEYCDRLDRSVMDFICRERIEEWFRPGAGLSRSHMQQRIFLGQRVDHDYLYDYQLVRGRQGDITENRTLLKEDGKTVHVPDAPLKTHSFSHAKVVMGPLGLLSRRNQADHDYRVLREEKVRGEETLVVEAVPKPGFQFPHLYGMLWLRKKDAGILKIEWNPASIGNYELVQKTADSLGLTPALVIISEYAFEKNGIRFPSRYTVKEIYRRGTSGAKYQISEVDVVYDQYKFFMVETDIKY